MRRVGVLLGGRPYHVEEHLRLDRLELARGDPAHHRPLARRNPLAQRRVEEVLDDRRPPHDLGRPDARGERHLPREVHLGADIGGKRFARVLARVERGRGGEPGGQHPFDHRAIKRLLGGEVVVEVRLRHAGALGDRGRRRPGESLFGEDRLPRFEKRPFVFRSDGRPPFSLRRPLLRNAVDDPLHAAEKLRFPAPKRWAFRPRLRHLTIWSNL